MFVLERTPRLIYNSITKVICSEFYYQHICTCVWIAIEKQPKSRYVYGQQYNSVNFYFFDIMVYDL